MFDAQSVNNLGKAKYMMFSNKLLIVEQCLQAMINSRKHNTLRIQKQTFNRDIKIFDARVDIVYGTKTM